MSPVRQKNLQVNGISLHITEQGTGPLVILCHGFPGLGWSWRRQLPALAAAGFRAVAPDMRGYGRSSRPAEVAAYTSDTLIADMTGLLDALGEEQAVFVGHDFGAPLVWNLAARQPQRVRAVVGVAYPYDGYIGGRAADLAPSERFAMVARQHFFHMHYFQQPGPADGELGQNAGTFLRRIYYALSAQGDLFRWRDFPAEGTGYLDVLAEPEEPLPWSWLTAADLEFMEREYTRPGAKQAFTGGLNYYRVADLNWQQDRRWRGAPVRTPALFLAGEEDPAIKLTGDSALQAMKGLVPDLRGSTLIPGAGHFVQMEAAGAFNSRLLEFLHSLNR